MLRTLVLLLLFGARSVELFSAADEKTSRQQYIDNWKNEAIYQMVVHKVPASITLAQGILESGDGNSRLAKEGNNHFGIKCHADWKGKTIHEDDETRGECFRRYDEARDSYEDHSAFLQRKRYESLFKLDTDDYKGWAKGLKQCGYATNPKYPDLLIGIVEEFKLHQYDEIGIEYIRKNKIPTRSAGGNEKEIVVEEKPTKKGRNKGKSGEKEERTNITINHNREIAVSENRIKFITVKPGETLESIANSLDMNAWQLKRYNDLTGSEILKEGQRLYIQPKRNKAKASSYQVKSGETLWSISQNLGVKMKKLQQLNGLDENSKLKAGQQLKLRK
ncbi:MAG: glucosaminidase domain-containing protein [Flavobacteriales bacterium]